MPIPIVVGSYVTTIRPVFEGAIGIAPNTRCLVAEIPKPTTDETSQTIIVQIPNTPIIIRINPADTLEGRLNIMEAIAQQKDFKV
jgi:hypothetical protein